MKKILSSVFASISLAAIIFCIACVIFDIYSNGEFVRGGYGITKMVIGTMFIGLGFGVPALIYDNENLTLGMRTLFHMGIGCTVLLITAFMVGWIPVKNGLWAMMSAIIGQLLVAFSIWFIFYLHNRRLAKKMNERIKKL
ncbi:hypothetical protein IV49_GL000801 [Kandleria vitulina DSM 20405]|uniref:DUF3021 domain-containing protein n=1 Tax=Kandleria vitulina DSM 20405 TaxID=1410657 RepID=A0A0R2HE67_9FIRM|nr:DUF3021 domain-containing protein [Kandleria vitulina]KRN51331.1 hypothetical protein IV49_GL000801 [Kandleria vitulina DSM 20405]